eukprot:TRINITY_DN50353_c0_g1_i1.p1 TRINITY_DN50353_c0_g1~~TRINITY_DN50353_c0_g1_i1.p1  ORF type:complete len:617 (+),score=99.54 TRINITY_DN50353_c0_g1_i1:283-2133(+)
MTTLSGAMTVEPSSPADVSDIPFKTLCNADSCTNYQIPLKEQINCSSSRSFLRRLRSTPSKRGGKRGRSVEDKRREPSEAPAAKKSCTLPAPVVGENFCTQQVVGQTGVSKPYKPGSEPQGGRLQSGSPRSERILRQVFVLLQKLAPGQRRQVLQERFTQQQRLALEAWMCSRGDRDGHIAHASVTVPNAAGGDEDFDASRHSGGDGSGRLCQATGPPADHVAHRARRQASHLAEISASSTDTAENRAPPSARVKQKHDPRGGVEAQKMTKRERAAGTVRGISRHYFRHSSSVYYCAVVCIDNLRISSRKVQDPQVAHDCLSILTAIKQSVVALPTASLPDRVATAFQKVIDEQRVDLDDWGLRFSVELHCKWWLKSRLSTPPYRDLGDALQAWSNLERFRSRSSGPLARIERRQRLSTDAQEWESFLQTWLDIVEAAGHCRRRWESQLRRSHKEAQPYREREMMAMRKERQRNRDAASVRSSAEADALAWREPWTRGSVVQFEEQRRRRREQKERRFEARQAVLMAREDRRSRCWQQHASLQDLQGAVISRLLSQWQLLEDRQTAKNGRREAVAAAAALARKAKEERRTMATKRRVRRANASWQELKMVGLLGTC